MEVLQTFRCFIVTKLWNVGLQREYLSFCFHLYLNYFPEILGALSKEQAECFHKYMKKYSISCGHNGRNQLYDKREKFKRSQLKNIETSIYGKINIFAKIHFLLSPNTSTLFCRQTSQEKELKKFFKSSQKYTKNTTNRFSIFSTSSQYLHYSEALWIFFSYKRITSGKPSILSNYNLTINLRPYTERHPFQLIKDENRHKYYAHSAWFEYKGICHRHKEILVDSQIVTRFWNGLKAARLE